MHVTFDNLFKKHKVADSDFAVDYLAYMSTLSTYADKQKAQKEFARLLSELNLDSVSN